MGERLPGSTATASPATPARSDPDGLPVGWLIAPTYRGIADARAGCVSRVIMEVLGHSQISITMNTYSHISEAQSREAANRMGDLFQFTSGAPLAATLAANDLTASDKQPHADDKTAAD
jgi:hypothetical protein